jgi:hypothetical protein
VLRLAMVPYQMPQDPLDMEQREYPRELTRTYHRAGLLAFLMTCPIPIGVYVYYHVTLPEGASVWSDAPWYAWLSLAPVLLALMVVTNFMLHRLPCPGCGSREILIRGRNSRAYVMCARCRIAWKTDISL